MNYFLKMYLLYIGNQKTPLDLPRKSQKLNLLRSPGSLVNKFVDGGMTCNASLLIRLDRIDRDEVIVFALIFKIR